VGLYFPELIVFLINFLTGGYFKMDPWVKKLLKAQ